MKTKKHKNFRLSAFDFDDNEALDELSEIGITPELAKDAAAGLVVYDNNNKYLFTVNLIPILLGIKSLNNKYNDVTVNSADSLFPQYMIVFDNIVGIDTLADYKTILKKVVDLFNTVVRNREKRLVRGSCKAVDTYEPLSMVIIDVGDNVNMCIAADRCGFKQISDSVFCNTIRELIDSSASIILV